MTISRIRLLQTPGGTLGPVAHGFSCPCRGLVRVARSARIGDFVFIGHVWRDERECVSANFHVSDCGGDFRHVAGDAAASRRTFLVMCMLFESSGARAIHGKRPVTIQA